MQAAKKIELRKTLFEHRLRLSEDEVLSTSEKILNTLSKNWSWAQIGNIHIYKPIKKYNEIDTKKFINFIKQNYPNIKIEVVPNKLSAGAEMPKGKDYDMVIVPMLGFDRRGYRLGYGGGYYDKFLAKNNCKQIVGLAYGFSEIDEIPEEIHDKKMDKIITEKEIISLDLV